jgi:hypothetical protein
MAKHYNLDITNTLISKTFGISDVTINKTLKKIGNYKQIVLNNDYTDKILSHSIKNSSIINVDDDENEDLVIIPEDLVIIPEDLVIIPEDLSDVTTLKSTTSKSTMSKSTTSAKSSV